MSKALQEVAKDLLDKEAVSVVIGYGQGSDETGVTPIFVTKAGDVGKLTWNPLCVHNLAVYLTHKKKEIKAHGKPAIVAKGCDVKSIVGLIQEHQIKREDVVILGVTCNGVVANLKRWDCKLSDENRAYKCRYCGLKTPKEYDYLIGERVEFEGLKEDPFDDVRELEEKGGKERWEFWQAYFKRCIRCYACRQVCPFCYCERCITDKTMPRWVDPSSHARGNLSWNIVRAMHLAGRCVGCGECERACPMGIPIALLNRKMAKEVKERFNYIAGYDSKVDPPFGTFEEDDDESFIR